MRVDGRLNITRGQVMIIDNRCNVLRRYWVRYSWRLEVNGEVAYSGDFVTLVHQDPIADFDLRRLMENELKQRNGEFVIVESFRRAS
jgi:hypothetical protein